MLVPRPEETDEYNDTRTNTITVIEGDTVFQDIFVKSVETEIVVDRTFKTPGYVYNLTLIRWGLLKNVCNCVQFQHARCDGTKHHHEVESSLC